MYLAACKRILAASGDDIAPRERPDGPGSNILPVIVEFRRAFPNVIMYGCD
jgi:hypothetical protein